MVTMMIQKKEHIHTVLWFLCSIEGSRLGPRAFLDTLGQQHILSTVNIRWKACKNKIKQCFI